MNQLLAHLVGDYIFQSDWMATEKTKRILPALLHGLSYTIPFLFLTTSPFKLLVICATHAIIDRYRLANWVARVKNWNFNATGYDESRPVWLTTWLMIIADNTLHLLINYFILK